MPPAPCSLLPAPSCPVSRVSDRAGGSTSKKRIQQYYEYVYGSIVRRGKLYAKLRFSSVTKNMEVIAVEIHQAPTAAVVVVVVVEVCGLFDVERSRSREEVCNVEFAEQCNEQAQTEDKPNAHKNQYKSTKKKGDIQVQGTGTASSTLHIIFF